MVILYNPHIDDFLGEPPHFRILHRRPLKKYGFLISEMLAGQEPLRILFDAELSAFLPNSVFSRLPRLMRRLIATVEFNVWCKLNRLSRAKVECVSTEHLSGDDTVLAFSYKAACGNFERRLAYFRRCRAVVFHLSHYFVATREKSDNLRRLHNVFLAGDTDISDNFYFNRHFGWYQRPFLVLPFAVAPRFSCRIPYAERDAKCLATGSFHDLTREEPVHKYVDYITSSGLSTYHPLRKAIFDAHKTLTDRIVCRISPFRDYDNINLVRRFISHFNISQKNYFAQDIVSLYNQYRYAVVGEEWSGFPALGALEAMACGALLIGHPNCFNGLDIFPDEHFVAHDGTLAGLLKVLSKIEFDKARALAEAGRHEVASRFSSKSVYRRWLDELSKVGLS